MPHSSRWPTSIVLAAILLFAAWLRFWGMDYGLPHPTARPDEERIVGRAFHILATGDFRPGTRTYPGLMIYLDTLALAVYAWVGQLLGVYRERFDFLWRFNAKARKRKAGNRGPRGVETAQGLLPEFQR